MKKKMLLIRHNLNMFFIYRENKPQNQIVRTQLSLNSFVHHFPLQGLNWDEVHCIPCNNSYYCLNVMIVVLFLFCFCYLIVFSVIMLYLKATKQPQMTGHYSHPAECYQVSNCMHLTFSCGSLQCNYISTTTS